MYKVSFRYLNVGIYFKLLKSQAQNLFFQVGTKIACPTAVALTATSAIALTAGSAAPAAVVGGTAGVTGCYIASTQCKRGVSIVMVVGPLFLSSSPSERIQNHVLVLIAFICVHRKADWLIV